MTDTDFSPGHIGIGVYPASGVVSDSVEKQDAFPQRRRLSPEAWFSCVRARTCRAQLVPPRWPAQYCGRCCHDVGRQSRSRCPASLDWWSHCREASWPYLDFDRLNRAGKLVVGFSDNSLINLTVSVSNGQQSLHCLSDVTFGFSVFAEGRYPATLESFLNAVRRGEVPTLIFRGPP